MAKKPDKKMELELNAWERFERAVDVVAKSPPQPRIKTKSDKPADRKKKPAGKPSS